MSVPRATLATGLALLITVTVTPSAQAQTPQSPESVFPVGEPFPTLALPALEDGRPRSVADFRGQKLILHVFASW